MLLKIVTLLPFVGPAAAKALARSGAKPVRVFKPYIPKFFPKWDQTTDGLEDAWRWSQTIQRSFLPAGMRFPKVGDIWQAAHDCQVSFTARIGITWQQAASTGLLERFRNRLVCGDSRGVMVSGIANLREGTRVRILSTDDAAKPLLVQLLPLGDGDLPAEFLPEDIKQTPGYCDFELSLKTARTPPEVANHDCSVYLNEDFRLVQDAD